MYPFVKRFFDCCSSAIAILILTPILLPIALICRFTAEGEVFYFQRRIGYKNKYFDIWKFATMLKNSPNLGTGSITLRNDPRVTPIGTFLRKSKINELPQLFNVLLGHMSVVGPRPLVDRTFNAYPEHVRNTVYNTPPGITGIGSIIFRDEEQLISEFGADDPHAYYSRVVAPYKGELEMWYQENKGFGVDFALILLTIWAILFKKSNLHYKLFPSLPKRTF